MRVLEHVYAGCTVELHDRNQGPRLYDLDLKGPVRGAAEVGRVTDPGSQEAYAHYDKRLSGARSELLAREWHLSFADIFDADESRGRQYPRQPAPPTGKLAEILARLERRGIWELGGWWEYRELTERGWEWGDDDVRSLFELVGPRAADRAWSMEVPDGGPGGWTFDFIGGLTSGQDPDIVAADVAERLASDSDHLKAGQSGFDVRLAVLVYDLTTPVGYSTSLWEPAAVPLLRLELPEELTGVVVVGVNGLVAVFDRVTGWRREDLPG